jgi:hypothetical protein
MVAPLPSGLVIGQESKRDIHGGSKFEALVIAMGVIQIRDQGEMGAIAIVARGDRCAPDGAVEVRTAVLEAKARDGQMTRRVELAFVEPCHARGVEEERSGVLGHGRAACEGIPDP